MDHLIGSIKHIIMYAICCLLHWRKCGALMPQRAPWDLNLNPTSARALHVVLWRVSCFISRTQRYVNIVFLPFLAWDSNYIYTHLHHACRRRYIDDQQAAPHGSWPWNMPNFASSLWKWWSCGFMMRVTWGRYPIPGFLVAISMTDQQELKSRYVKVIKSPLLISLTTGALWDFTQHPPPWRAMRGSNVAMNPK